jgi:hypothetical protein
MSEGSKCKEWTILLDQGMSGRWAFDDLGALISMRYLVLVLGTKIGAGSMLTQTRRLSIQMRQRQDRHIFQVRVVRTKSGHNIRW